MLTENVAQRKLLFLKVLLMCSNHESIFIYMGKFMEVLKTIL